jgi:hypothetical protein
MGRECIGFVTTSALYFHIAFQTQSDMRQKITENRKGNYRIRDNLGHFDRPQPGSIIELAFNGVTPSPPTTFGQLEE